MVKKKKFKKNRNNCVEVCTEEQYEEYLKEVYSMDFIVGFTENGVPYGICYDKNKENNKLDIPDISPNISDHDDLPF